MWDLLKKKDEECSRVRDLLEESAAVRPDAARREELSEAWTPAQRAHMAECAKCQDAAQDLLAARKIFAVVASSAEIERPWFASRVMTAIAARQRELSDVANTWLAVPKFASRLALASCALLLVASTWLYERPLPTSSQQASTLAGQESLFEAPPLMNQDDVLANQQENNP